MRQSVQVLDPSSLRSETLRRVDQAGFPRPPVHFPVLWESHEKPALRRIRDIVERVAVLNVIVNCSYGMPPEAASDWIANNGLTARVTDRERLVLTGELARVEADRAQIEAINALAWVLALVATLDVSQFCGDDLARTLPDLRNAEPIEEWLQRSAVEARDIDVVAAEWDLHFCLTWGIADSNLRATTAPGSLPQHVYWQRRRAFEFAFDARELLHRDWDNIDLST